MADSFNIHFEDNVLVGQGYKFDREANDNCFDFVVKENPNDSLLAKMQMEPVSYVKKEWLYGPATCLSSRRIIYPCTRFRCSLPCPCLICRKRHPTCRVPASHGCDCQNCRMQYLDHSSFHAAYHYGCKFCHQIVKILPNFNFFFLDKKKKAPIYPALPTFSKPPGQKVSDGLLSDWRKKLYNLDHDIEDDGIWCLGCCWLFWTVDQLREHLLTKHNLSKSFSHIFINNYKEVQSLFKCCQCASSYASRCSLQQHIDSVHYTMNFTCDKCESTFTRRDSYERHRKNKHPEDEKQSAFFGCEQCEKTFTRKSDLYRHIKESCIFGEDSSFKCQLCDTSFKRKSDLKRHNNTSFNTDGSSKYVCTQCDRNLCNRKLLMIHCKTQHGDAPGSFHCHRCETSFVTDSDLKVHKNATHFPELYRCENCETTFSKKENLKRHLSIQKAGRHACKECGNSFCNRALLRQHENAPHATF